MAQIGAQIRRADKDRIDTINRQDVVQRLVSGAGFQLCDKAHFVICTVQIVGMARKGSGTRTCPANTAYPVRRIAHRLHKHFSLLATFNHRHNQCLAATIQKPLDDHRLAPRGPHKSICVISGNDLQLRQDRRDVIRGMFAIDQQPVKIGCCRDFGRNGRTLRQPAPDGLPACFQISLEAVHWCRHCTSLQNQ